MGKGKGAPEGFVVPVTPGRIVIEAEGVPFNVAKEALRLGATETSRCHQVRGCAVITSMNKTKSDEEFRDKRIKQPGASRTYRQRETSLVRMIFSLFFLRLDYIKIECATRARDLFSPLSYVREAWSYFF